ncbi:MAG: FAD-dependent oxidoreductase [Cyanobacteria bacterium QS_8_64_29]|nr:MAG: FAD-dependent oxidoreductase [Cyanobacteria bacterium QS_8_64_29]
MSEVAVVGAGAVGAVIAYELSREPHLNVTLFDAQQPATGATGAALGLLLGAISGKTRGRAWRLREASLRRYETLIPELETLTGRTIPYNRQGLLQLRLSGDDPEPWQQLAATRSRQGWPLELWDRQQLQARCPHAAGPDVTGAVHSPCDRQLDPSALTQALVAGAQVNGAACQWGMAVESIEASERGNQRAGQYLHTTAGRWRFDWLVLAAGLGTASLAASLAPPPDLRPVLGQALRVRLPQTLGDPAFQPAITGGDVHLIPLGGREYWVGATVEFPDAAGEVSPNPAQLEQLWQAALGFCPALAEAEIRQHWWGRRPRPEGRAAPIIEALPGYRNVWVAAGHYRNGVLLAPATAQAIREVIGTATAAA